MAALPSLRDHAHAASGLDLLSRMIAGDFPQPGMARTMGFRLAEVSEGRAVFRGRPGPEHMNPNGAVHGGWAATILDSALGCAVQCTCAAGEVYTTVEIKVNLDRPIAPDGDELVCEGRIVHRGRRIAASEATLKDAAGRLLAHGTSTCLILPLDRPNG